MIRPIYVTNPENIPENWEDHLVRLWVEDDIPTPDKETTESAFKRIAGETRGEPIHEIDQGDCSVYFYRGGWVKVISFDGGCVGILVQLSQGTP